MRGNYQVIQELEGVYRGAGWNVIKVVWGSDWDALLEKDEQGVLVERMNETVDGQYQLYTVKGGDFIREDFFGKSEALRALVEDLSDEDLEHLTRGGHDPVKVYNAYRRAVEHSDGPTVILAQTIKGYGLGEAGEASNVAHKRKSLEEEELKAYRDRFHLPISDEAIADAPFYRPDEDSEELAYLQERRKALGGYLPRRTPSADPLPPPGDAVFAEYLEGAGDREVATTMVMVQLMSKLMKDNDLGQYVVPIVPDESRTFGMDSLFRKFGIYSHVGQRYEPVDKGSLMYYRESEQGADSGRGHHRGGLDGLVHRRRHVVRHARHSHHSVLLLLLYVRLSAHG